MCDIYLERIKLYEISTALDYQKIEKLKDQIDQLKKQIDEFIFLEKTNSKYPDRTNTLN